MGVELLTRVPITFDAADRRTHAPLVTGSVGGIETLFVLDTGSEVHILTKELVDGNDEPPDGRNSKREGRRWEKLFGE